MKLPIGTWVRALVNGKTLVCQIVNYARINGEWFYEVFTNTPKNTLVHVSNVTTL